MRISCIYTSDDDCVVVYRYLFSWLFCVCVCVCACVGERAKKENGHNVWGPSPQQFRKTSDFKNSIQLQQQDFLIKKNLDITHVKTTTQYSILFWKEGLTSSNKTCQKDGQGERKYVVERRDRTFRERRKGME